MRNDEIRLLQKLVHLQSTRLYNDRDMLLHAKKRGKRSKEELNTIKTLNEQLEVYAALQASLGETYNKLNPPPPPKCCICEDDVQMIPYHPDNRNGIHVAVNQGRKVICRKCVPEVFGDLLKLVLKYHHCHPGMDEVK